MSIVVGRGGAERRQRSGKIALRALLAIAGGYAVTWVLAYWLAKVLPLEATEAVIVTSFLGLLIYPLLMVWAFSCPRVSRVFAVFAAVLLVGLIPLMAGRGVWW